MAAAPSRCLLVTGPPGVGKTTLVTRAFETLRTSHPHLKIRGFYTREVRESGERVGFEVVTLDGRRGPLASSKVSSRESVAWPIVGKYKVDIASLEHCLSCRSKKTHIFSLLMKWVKWNCLVQHFSLLS